MSKKLVVDIETAGCDVDSLDEMSKELFEYRDKYIRRYK